MEPILLACSFNTWGQHRLLCLDGIVYADRLHLSDHQQQVPDSKTAKGTSLCQHAACRANDALTFARLPEALHHMHTRCCYSWTSSIFIWPMSVMSCQLKGYGLAPHLPCLVSSDAAILLRLLAHMSSCSNCGIDAFLQGPSFVVQGPPVLQAWLSISVSLSHVISFQSWTVLDTAALECFLPHMPSLSNKGIITCLRTSSHGPGCASAACLRSPTACQCICSECRSSTALRTAAPGDKGPAAGTRRKRRTRGFFL